MSCESISNCIAKLTPPLLFLSMVAGAFYILGFGNPSEAMAAKLEALILDAFGGTMLWLRMKNE